MPSTWAKAGLPSMLAPSGGPAFCSRLSLPVRASSITSTICREPLRTPSASCSSDGSAQGSAPWRLSSQRSTTRSALSAWCSTGSVCIAMLRTALASSLCCWRRSASGQATTYQATSSQIVTMTRPKARLGACSSARSRQRRWRARCSPSASSDGAAGAGVSGSLIGQAILPRGPGGGRACFRTAR